MDKLSDDEIILAAENTRVRKFRKGQLVPVVRGTERIVYIVAEGMVSVQSGLAESTIGSRQSVGWFELLADVEAPVVKVLSECVLLELSGDFLMRALEDNYLLARAIIRGNAERILELRGGLPRSEREHVDDSAKHALTGKDTLLDRLLLFDGGPLDRGSLDAGIAVARRMKRVVYEPGEEIFSLGEPARWWVNILEGTAECSNAAGSAEVRGEYTIGVMDAIAEQPRSYGAVAKTRVLAYIIDYEDFASVLETHSDLALGIVQMTSANVFHLSQIHGSMRPGAPAKA